METGEDMVKLAASKFKKLLSLVVFVSCRDSLYECMIRNDVKISLVLVPE